jgi:hypothetical protein
MPKIGENQPGAKALFGDDRAQITGNGPHEYTAGTVCWDVSNAAVDAGVRTGTEKARTANRADKSGRV